VLGESYSRGWRAWCSGGDGRERALGEPEPADGFGNAWRVEPGCSEARFSFAPSRLAGVGYAISLLALAAMLVVLLLPVVRRRRRSGAASAAVASARDPWAGSGDFDAPDTRIGLGWGPALAVAAAIGLVGAGLFALRTGPGLALGALVLLRARVNERELFALAAAGIVLVPVLYLGSPAPDFGGYFFEYSTHHIEAHWVMVGVVACLVAGCALAASRLRRRDRA
jgi:arabinofuranan 3-O-arabinosyltransferase